MGEGERSWSLLFGARVFSGFCGVLTRKVDRVDKKPMKKGKERKYWVPISSKYTVNANYDCAALMKLRPATRVTRICEPNDTHHRFGRLPYVYSYNIFINRYCESKRIDDRTNLYQEMSEERNYS